MYLSRYALGAFGLSRYTAGPGVLVGPIRWLNRPRVVVLALSLLRVARELHDVRELAFLVSFLAASDTGRLSMYRSVPRYREHLYTNLNIQHILILRDMVVV